VGFFVYRHLGLVVPTFILFSNDSYIEETVSSVISVN